MAPPLSHSIRLEMRLTAFGVYMNEIRSWLDHHKIEPVSFTKIATADPQTIAFDIAFTEDRQVRLFEQKFAREDGLFAPEQCLLDAEHGD